MIVYKIDTGEIINQIPEEQDLMTFYFHFPQEFKEGLSTLDSYIDPSSIYRYRVFNNELINLTDTELYEIETFKKILSVEEREENQILDKIKPSNEEIRKAEETLKLLELLQEVM